MAIIIKDNSLTINNGEKLYRDALVSEGTLGLIDLSNLGGTDNYNVRNGATIFNLARETEITPSNYSIDTRVNFKLSDGKGISTSNLETEGYINNINELKGLMIGSEIGDYLASNKTHRSLHIFWVRRNPDSTSTQTQLLRSANDTKLGDNYRMNIQKSGAMTLRLAGAYISTQPIPLGNLIQIAVEYINDTTAPIVYINGNYAIGATIVATTSGGFNSGENSAVGNFEGVTSTPNYFYRMLVEDLTVSGRSALEVIQKDFMYVNGIGDFDYIEPRPFVNNL